MKAGMGKAKGSRFEHDTAIQLSLWLTSGANAAVFGRNVLSGGVFTTSRGRGTSVVESGLSGDMAGVRPEAHELLSLFAVECKHYADLGLVAFLRDKRGASFLAKTISHTAKQATDAEKEWIVIARQDRMDTMIFTNVEIGMRARLSSSRPEMISYHTLCNNTIDMMWFPEFLQFVDAKRFLQRIKGYRGE